VITVIAGTADRQKEETLVQQKAAVYQKQRAKQK